MPDKQNATQDGRMLRLTTPLGKDALLIRQLTAEEAIGSLFRYQLDMLSQSPGLDGAKLLGQPVSLIYTAAAGELRQFNGIISHFSQTDAAPDDEGVFYYHYLAEVRPQLYRLTLASHCRFFHDMSVLEIVKQVLKDHSVDVTDHCSQRYRKLEHCVQYNETDFTFFSRLLEHEGIYYFFTHQKGKDRLTLADAPTAHDDLPRCATLLYGIPTDQGVVAWRQQHTQIPQRSEINTYDFVKPGASLTQGLLSRASLGADQSHGLQHGQDNYLTSDEGKHYATVHLQAWQAQSQLVEAECHAGNLLPGTCFSLKQHPNRAFNTRHLLIGVEYRLHNNGYSSARRPAQPIQCSFRAIPASQPYRMPMETPRPLLTGPQTATVIGDKDGDIHLDKYGRIQVQFHWEQFAPPAKSKRSQRCWVRVAQHWAGKGWGAVFTPRAGQEVIVDFINGDIDQPLVTGCVYNAANMQPYPLPKRGAVSTIRSRSTEGDGFNELRFIDTKGQEQLFLHAEKDWKTYVKNDAMTWVGHDRHLVVEGEQRLLVKKDQDSQIEGKQQLQIKQDQHASIAGEQRVQIKKDQHCQIDGQQHLRIKGKQHVQIDGDQLQQIKGSQQVRVGGEQRQKIDGKISLDGAQGIEVKAGANLVLNGNQLYLTGNVNLVLGGQSISIKAGGSFITLGPNGIHISGPMVKINSGGSAKSAKKSSTSAPGKPGAPSAPNQPKAPKPSKQDDGSKEVS